MSAPVSAWRAAALLAGLRLRRRLNQLGASLGRVRVADKKREASARTSPVRWLLTGLAGVWLLAGATIFAHEALLNMERVLGSTLVQVLPQPAARLSDAAPRPDLIRVPLPPLSGDLLAPGVIQGATLALSLLMVVALLFALTGREIASPEWDLEWLATLPLPLPTLLASRIIERVATNTSGLVALVPFLSMLAWFCGYGWSAPALGVGYALVLLFVVATVQTLVDTGLRLSLPPHRLRNLHALISIAGVLTLFAVVSIGLPDRTFILELAALLPGWFMWSPPGVAVRALASAESSNAMIWSGTLGAETLLIVITGIWALAKQLRHGVVSAGAREAVVRHPASQRSMTARVPARSLLSPVQWRELQLLARDRTFGVQTLVLPLVIVGMQVLLNAGSGIFAGAVDAPATLAVIAFGLASYTLMFSAFRTLNAEGQALWILYCVPPSLESVLREKAVLWSGIAAFFPLAMFMIAMIMAGGASPTFLAAAAIVMVGVPIFAVIATALGVFGCDPLTHDARQRLRAPYLYLYMLLASLYSFAIFTQDPWQRVGLVTLTGLLAVALWQKARDRSPYLLDPSASPPASVSVADGLIAALLFFVLQALIAEAALPLLRSRVAIPGILGIAYCGAGALTYGVMRFVYWRAGTAGVPQIWGAGVPAALGWGTAGGMAAAVAAIGYFELARRFDLWPAGENLSGGLDEIFWFAAIAVLAAPLFEEFIFCGLIFGGLRSYGFVPAAFASAAVFALAHPPAALLPIIVLGLCAAVACERARMLAAPMLVHGIYNAAVILWGLH